MGHQVAAPRATQEVLSDYLQRETSLKQAIIILGHHPFFILACFSATKISMAGHASYSSLHPSVDNHIKKIVNFQSRGAFCKSQGITGKTSKTGLTSPLSDRPKQIVFHCKQLFS